MNDHFRQRSRRRIITLTVIATGIRTERHGFGWRRHIIPMRRHVLAIYVAVEGAGVGAAIGPAVFPGPCARPCSLIFVAPILVAISDAVIALGAVIIAWSSEARRVGKECVRTCKSRW